MFEPREAHEPGTAKPHPVSRKESQAHTRKRLIAVGREHFLKDGLAGAVVEKIAAEAGYTRGALYANFRNKDELFIAVMQATRDASGSVMTAILKSGGPLLERINRLREAYGDLVTNPEWVVLQTEFQSNAMRSEPIREAYLEIQSQRRKDIATMLAEATEQGLRLSAAPEDIIAALSSLSEGLAVRQAIAKQSDPEHTKALAMMCFDRLMRA